MIAAKLIVQFVLGIGAIGGITAGGYVMFSEKNQKYLLVTSVLETTNQPTADLWEAPTPSKADTKIEQNYICNIDTNNTNCKLYSITFDATNKSINWQDIDQNAKDTQLIKAKTQLTEKTYFLLEVNQELYEKASFVENKNIKLMSKNERTKSYANLTVHAKINGKQIVAPTNLILVKKSDAGQDSLNATEANKTYKCKFENQTPEATACSIYSFTTGTLAKDKDVKALDWQTLTITTTATAITSLEANKYYVIKWDKKPLIDWKDANKKVIIFEGPVTTGVVSATKTTKFTIESPIIGSFEASKQQAIILK